MSPQRSRRANNSSPRLQWSYREDRRRVVNISEGSFESVCDSVCVCESMCVSYICSRVKFFEISLLFVQQLQRILRFIQTLQTKLPNLLKPRPHLETHTQTHRHTHTHTHTVVFMFLFVWWTSDHTWSGQEASPCFLSLMLLFCKQDELTVPPDDTTYQIVTTWLLWPEELMKTILSSRCRQKMWGKKAQPKSALTFTVYCPFWKMNETQNKKCCQFEKVLLMILFYILCFMVMNSVKLNNLHLHSHRVSKWVKKHWNINLVLSDVLLTISFLNITIPVIISMSPQCYYRAQRSPPTFLTAPVLEVNLKFIHSIDVS